jgi:hypothetical protein
MVFGLTGAPAATLLLAAPEWAVVVEQSVLELLLGSAGSVGPQSAPSTVAMLRASDGSSIATAVLTSNMVPSSHYKGMRSSIMSGEPGVCGTSR